MTGIQRGHSRYTVTMGAIDLYQVLRRIPEVSEDKAKQAADSIAQAGHAATKADLLQLENRLIKWVIGTVLIINGLAITILKFT